MDYFLGKGHISGLYCLREISIEHLIKSVHFSIQKKYTIYISERGREREEEREREGRQRLMFSRFDLLV